MTATIAPAEDLEAQRIRRLLKIGKRVGIVGLVVLLIGGAMLGTGLFQAFKDLSQTREHLTTEIAVPGTSEVHLEAGTYDLVAIGQGLIRRTGTSNSGGGRLKRAAYMEPNVKITGRIGSPLVTAVGSNSSFSYSNNNYDLVSMGSFRVHRAGTYFVEVTGEPGPVETIGIGPSTGTPGGALALGGGALLALGVLIAIGGIATYVTSRIRNNRRQARFSPMPNWAPVPGPPGYANGPQAGGYGTGPQGGAPASTWPPPPPPPPSSL